MDNRALLAIAVSFVLLIAYQVVVIPLTTPPAPVPPTAAKTPAPSVPPAEPSPAPKPEAAAVPAPVSAPPAVEVPARTFTISNDRLVMTLTNLGASVESVALKAFPAEASPSDPSVSGSPSLQSGAGPFYHTLRAPAAEPRPLALIDRRGSEPLDRTAWEVTEEKTDRVVFRHRCADWLEFVKTVSLPAGRYAAEVTVDLANANTAEEKNLDWRYGIVAARGILPDSPFRKEQFLRGAAGRGGSPGHPGLKEISGADVLKERVDLDGETEPIAWAGVAERFFAVLLAPGPELAGQIRQATFEPVALRPADAPSNVRVTIETKGGPLPPGGRIRHTFAWYNGPQDADALAGAAPGLERVINFTGPDFLAGPMMALLKLLGNWTGNLGLAIIAATLIIRLLLFPLNKKSQVSAFQMQKIGPHLQKLKERCGEDKQKFALEQMKLFREHGVNPLSGCLPMFLQIPVFIAFYSVLESGVIFRRAEFAGWIHDLAQPDRLLPHAPVIGELNLLPIVMTATWMAQSMMMPKSPDPQMAQQQKIFQYMPLMFGWMCYGLGAGLSLYFFVNSLLGIAEQKLIKKVFLK